MSSSRFDDPLPVDPELRELLREISARQESRLLHAQVPRSPAALFEADTAIRASATGLIAAERELLTRYREEVACLLRRLALEVIQSSDGTRRFICEYVSADRRIHLSGVDPPRARLTAEADRLRGGFPADSASLCILECASVGLHPSAVASTLAMASLRLEPHDDARIYLGQEQFAGGSSHTALETFTYIAHAARTPIQRACAYSWVGVLLGRDGDHARAAEAQREAMGLNPSPPAHPLNWLAYAVQAEDRNQLVEVARVVDERFARGGRALGAWIENAREQRARGEWVPATVARKMALLHLDSHGPATRRLLSVFL